MAATQAVLPNSSLYIQNLPEKYQKEELRRELYTLFSTYGPVLDITALKTAKMRGQAHVLFRDVQSATQALRSCQSFEFGDRPIKISYSKNRSNTLAKLTGTFGQPNASTSGAQKTGMPPSGFPAPPGSFPAPPGGLPAPPGTKVNGTAPSAGLKAPARETEEVASPQGVKRPREESDDEGDAPMEEDDDEEGGEMDMSDED